MDTESPPLHPETVRLAAVGDILLPTDAAGVPTRSDEALFEEIWPVLAEADIVHGNLECTLSGEGEIVETEPRVLAIPEQIRGVASAGFNAVTLANNHMFDCYLPGFHRVRDLLAELNVAHFGAGENLDEAASATIVERKDIRFAFLSAVDEETGPTGFASTDSPGVATMDLDRMLRDTRRLKESVDHVVFSLHWGRERFRIPSPRQVEQAHALIDAGASMIVGHHPHVAQGLELHRSRPIAYSLGNFVAAEVPFTDGDRVTWNQRERTGCLLFADFKKDDIQNVRQVPTYDDGDVIRVDRSGYGEDLLRDLDHLVARGITDGLYSREAFRVQKIMPLWRHLRDLVTFRPRKYRKLFRRLLGR